MAKMREIETYLGSLTVRGSVPLTERGTIKATDMMAWERKVARVALERGCRAWQALKYLREAAELTGADLAELLAVQPATLSRWENGHVEPDVATWAIYAAIAADALAGSSATLQRLKRLKIADLEGAAPVQEVRV